MYTRVYICIYMCMCVYIYMPRRRDYIYATSSFDMCERKIIYIYTPRTRDYIIYMPPPPWTCANERLYYIHIYMRLEREIILYICVYLLLGHVQHVFHHLDLAAAIKKKNHKCALSLHSFVFFSPPTNKQLKRQGPSIYIQDVSHQ